MPLQATFLRERVTFNRFFFRTEVAFAFSVMTEPPGW